MKKLLLFTFLLYSIHSFSQKKYDRLWNQVEELELKERTRLANDVVTKILEKAKRSNKSDQIVKGFIYKSKFAFLFKENAQKEIIKELEGSIKEFPFPTNALLESVYAECLYQYLQYNRNNIRKRTQLKFPKESNDFEKWDTDTFFSQIDKHYRASLRNETELKKQSINGYEILLTESKNSEKFRPTLYDFLVQRAVKFYDASKWNIKRPKDRFYINNPVVFKSTKLFTKEAFYTTDSILSKKNVLKLYQKLELFHQQKNTTAYIDVVLERLQFSRKNAIIENKDTLYLKALKTLSREFQKEEPSSFINYYIANFYFEASNNTGAKNNPNLKYNRIKALTICNDVLSKFPNSDGGLLCSILKNKIQEQSITIETEKYVVPEKPFLAKVSFKSIDSLYISVYKVPHNSFKNIYSYVKDSAVIDLIKKRKPELIRFYKLQPKKDFYSYSTEVDLPKLSKGKYLLVASNGKEITKNNQLYSYSILTATNLSFVSVTKGNRVMLKVLDRFQGNPIQGANIFVTGKSFSENGMTDKNGEFYLRRNSDYHSNLSLTTVFEGDTLAYNNYHLSKHYDYNSESKNDMTRIDLLLYTDRSIYRPGQTLYFKGILMEQRNGKSRVVPNTSISIIIRDANYEELKKIRLKTNEYGSISGEFKIPRNVLTGEFSIGVDDDFGTEKLDVYYKKVNEVFMRQVYFSVEEYKKPRFEATFKDVKENYTLGDSIQVTGNAKALLGTPITNAKVTYSITRKLVHNWSRNYRSSSEQLIKTSTIQTDSKGDFVVGFIANPDSLVMKKKKPVFLYTIKADVTDINGETRSATKTIKVGFHNLKVDAIIDHKLNRSNLQQFSILTKNLNDQSISADLEISVYKLTSPNRVLRKKPWGIVEIPSLDKDAFVKLFPYEVYDSTDIKKHWKKGTLVFSKKLKSEDAKNIGLEDIKKWKPGAYLLLVKATDIVNDEVSVEKQFEIYDPKEETLSDHQLFSYEIINSEYKKDGVLAIKLRTAAHILHVTLEAFYKGKSIFNKTVPISNGHTILKIPIKKGYKGKVDFNIYFSKFNSLYTDKSSVSFPEVEKQLNIETLSFRNKLTPNKKETWSFKITNSDNKSSQAEILASMYDTSLDQFKNHSWDTNIDDPNRPYYSAPYVQNYGFFTTKKFDLFKPFNRYYNVTTLVRNYHQLRSFGFNFGDSRYKNAVYLSMLEDKVKFPNRTKGNIRGIVVDNSGALPGASVLIKGTKKGTVTDSYGFYSLDAPAGSELVFSYIGYNTESILIGKPGTYNILLEEGGQALNEITMVAYKRSNKKSLEKFSYGPVGEVNAEVIQILNGLTPGVQAISVSGQQGGNSLIQIKGVSSMSDLKPPLYIIDEVPVDLKSGIQLNLEDFEDISFYKGSHIMALNYGNEGKNGVVIITTKKGLKDLMQVETRTDLKETAFFFPHLRTNKKGEVSFSFDSPQALTKWRLMLLAHNKSLELGTLEKFAVTQKEINVIPNTPRFLREKDTVVISVKVANFTKEQKSGTALLQLFDAVTMEPVSKKLIPLQSVQTFSIAPKGNTSLSWAITIPEGLQALQYKVVAKSGTHSDGETSILPVLSNRILVTESKSLWVNAGEMQEVVFEKLNNPISDTQKNHQFTLEFTSNPAWLAIKSLPYLMEFPYECAEQTFSRLYANTLASDILTKNPKIEEVFKDWKENGSIESPLEKNEDLKSILISESPWVRDLKNDKDVKARLAQLFDKEKVYEQQLLTFSKFKELQLSSGAFPWFSGGSSNPFITRHIVSGMGHLKKLNVEITSGSGIKRILNKAINYLDKEFISSYDKTRSSRKSSLDVNLSNSVVHYLYTRSFFLDSHPMSEKEKKIATIYLEEGKKSWLRLSLYNKGLLALSLYRNGHTTASKEIIEALDQLSVQSAENGMYWKENTKSWYWYKSPIETQALMIEAFTEIDKNLKKVDQLKQWLLKNKQTNSWSTTKATTEAIYALLMHGDNWLSVKDNTVITVGEEKIKTKKLSSVQKEAGTGYLKLNWKEDEITPKMSSIKIKNKSKVVGYGGVYWQYFEDLDKVTSSGDSPMQIKKSVFIKKTNSDGENLTPITNNIPIKVGDLLTVRIEITSKNDMEFVHLKDLRASGLEPINVLSKYKWQDGLEYYQSTKDVATHFFFEELPKGTYIFEYNLRANNSGNFSNGITTIQSMYAPEFSSHSKGIRIRIGPN